MKEIDSLHEQAMELFDNAFLAKHNNNKSLSIELLRKSLELEIRAAEILKDNLSAEPSRSVLYRSAASIAIQCKQIKLADELLTTALSGNPPAEIAAELQALLKVVKAKRRTKRSERIGVVRSDKMTETVVVRVDRLVKHPIYRKYIKKRKNLMAHDELGAKTGDKVRIKEFRRLSSTRSRWKIVEILKKAEK